MQTINIESVINNPMAVSTKQAKVVSKYLKVNQVTKAMFKLDFSNLNVVTTTFLKTLFQPLNEKHIKYQIKTNDRQAHVKYKIKNIKLLTQHRIKHSQMEYQTYND